MSAKLDLNAAFDKKIIAQGDKEDHAALIWLLVAVLVLALLSTACTSKSKVSPDELPQTFKTKKNIKSNDLALLEGKFHVYSKSELKKLKLKTSDFEYDSFKNQGQVLDSRMSEHQSMRLKRRYLTEANNAIEWTTDVFVQEVQSQSFVLSYNGQVSTGHKGAVLPLSQTVKCSAGFIPLQSGVKIAQMDCEQPSLVEKIKELDEEIVGCAIKPVGTNAVQREMKFGSFKVSKSNQVFVKAKKESTTTLGDVFCGKDSLGAGKETRVLISSSEEVNLLYPAPGTARRLFESRKVELKDGRIVSLSAEEMMGSNGSPVGSKRVTRLTKKSTLF